MKKIIFGILLSVSSLFPACQFLDNSLKGRILIDEDAEKQKARKQREEGQLNAIERKIEIGDYQSAQMDLEKFIAQNSNSIFFQRARFDLGLVLESDEKWSESLKIYQEIIANLPEDSKPLEARTHYQKAICYENLGDDTKALASLFDAEKSIEYLPQEIYLVEIPAKKATIYYRMGQRATAEKFLNQASQGISGLRASIRTEKDRAWVTTLFYKLGHLPNNSLNEGNLRAYLDTMGILQIFSLHAVEENMLPWSQKAQEDIRNSYRNAWSYIKDLDAKKISIESSRKSGAIDSSVMIQAEKNDLVGLLLEKMEELKRFQIPTPSKKADAAQAVFIHLDELKNEIKIESQKWSVQNPLTPETQSPRGIRK